MTHQEFLQIINPVKDKMYRMALRMLTSKEAAEDATQEVILKLWNRRKKIRQYSNPEAYTMTVTKNYCLDQLKLKYNNNLRIVHQNYESGSVSVHKETEIRDELTWVEKIIRQLPEQQQMVFQLRDVEQYEFEEISEIMNMEQTAIRVALSRARKKIRESLTKKHEYGIRKS
ncbi:RNA polymerase sigma factor [Autumnicola musiva]|uniref:Sigma-70 family RNA polymerase sigma factor n=1 Tax=Autumnicola musiva TaxID=3075589 RepID=A0ABU3D929_9FLAO|nr:sigma-70 family RNA polymerase sigma factor [Zunongwangia sp. F117]MDT0678041.1 sigma-70 family RNA polymerase sigma factor [Zunongwangia sp. F117]